MTDGGAILLVLRMTVSLAVVLGLLILTVRWLERRGVGRGGPARNRRNVEILQRAPLGKGASLQVVRVGARVLVLGVTDSNIRVLSDLDAADVEPEDSKKGEVIDLRALTATGGSGPRRTGPGSGLGALLPLRSVVRRQDSAANTIVGKISRGEGKHRGARSGRRRR